ncbi:hypothetical protein GCM10010517_26080 [Streptosporangium fragile]|uniref:Uncharacterized protein n=1 Tax=Streptosporangium fragile TaxID=46186 RepID=A0ABN3VV62_9ACTN
MNEDTLLFTLPGFRFRGVRRALALPRIRGEVPAHGEEALALGA